MMGLTAKQRELYDFIAATIAGKGVAPSYQEMAGALHLKSKSQSYWLAQQLEERGWIRRAGRKRRAIEILPQGDAVALHPEVRAAAVRYAEETHTTLSAVISEAVAAYVGKAA